MTQQGTALFLLAAALITWAPADTLVRRRLRRIGIVSDRPPSRCRRVPAARARGTPPTGGTTDPLGPEGPLGAGSPVRRRVLAGITGVAAGLLVGGPTGLVVAVVGAVVGERFLRRSTVDTGSARRVRDLPGACDLLAVCLSAGMPLTGALAAVSAALPGPLGRDLARVAALGRLGADTHRAWDDVAEELRPLARVLQRAAGSGASAASALTALAADCRAGARADTEAAVRRAGIRVLLPLGLCFLPAFVCLGVVPLVLGIAGDVRGPR
jgi:Flp pilus assembly protein TadB